jgi:transcriptional regulator with XRE-family HTH domain
MLDVTSQSAPESDIFDIGDYLGDPIFAAAYEDAEARARLLSDLVSQRKSMRMRQTDVAEAMETSQSFVSEFENGGTDPHLSTLQRYARAVAARLPLRIDLPAECPWQPRERWAQATDSKRYANRTTTTQPAGVCETAASAGVAAWKRAVEMVDRTAVFA